MTYEFELRPPTKALTDWTPLVEYRVVEHDGDRYLELRHHRGQDHPDEVRLKHDETYQLLVVADTVT